MNTAVEAGIRETEPDAMWRTFEYDGTVTLLISGTKDEIKTLIEGMREHHLLAQP